MDKESDYGSFMDDEGNFPDAIDKHERTKTYQCNRCNKMGLLWIETNEGWRLHEPDYTMHKCIPVKVKKVAKAKALTEQTKNDIIQSVTSIEVVEGGCIIRDNYSQVVVHNPTDALKIVEGVSKYLETEFRTAWHLLPGVQAERKLEELRIFLSMCKDKVDTKQMRKVLE